MKKQSLRSNVGRGHWRCLTTMGRRVTWLTLLISFSAVGCRQRLGDFTLASTKNIELSRLGEYMRAKKRIRGEDSKPIIFVFPTGQPNAEEAADRAIESVVGGVALVDVVIETSYFYIPYLFGESRIGIEGSVLYDPKVEGAGEIQLTDGASIPSETKKPQQADRRRSRPGRR